MVNVVAFYVIPELLSFSKGHYKFIDLKTRTKLTSPKKLLQQQKLPIAKLKTTKPNQLILLKTNNMAL